MAVSSRATGTRLKTTVSGSGLVSVSVPGAPVAAGDLLVLVLVYDCNENVFPVAGWQHTVHSRAGTASGGFAPPTVDVFHKIAVSGDVGGTVAVTFPADTWPAGSPAVLAWASVYTGIDTTAPVEVTAVVSASPGPAAAMAAPQVSVSTTGGWLLTLRVRSGTATTFTDSVGTDVSRVADSFVGLSAGLFDSNAALTPGLQTQRTTTAAAGTTSAGDVSVTITLKVGSTASNVTALAQTATVAATAYAATAVPVDGPWSLCSPDGLPVYTWAVNWDLSGQAAAGAILNRNPYVPFDLTGWSSGSGTITRTTDLLDGRTVPTMLVVPNGIASSGGVGASPHTDAGSVVPGQQYIADCWVFSPGGWSDLRACIDWYNVSDVFISTGLGSGTSVAAGTWTHLRQTLTAPALASRTGVRTRFGGTPAASNSFYVYGLLLMDPLAPETRITPAPTDVIGSDLLSPGAVWAYGRDQMRPVSPAALGTASFAVDNVHRVYSPDRLDSPLYGTLDAARPLVGQVVFGGVVYPLFTGRINDYNITSARDNRTVAFSFLDSESGFQTTPVTTGVYSGLRTGAAVGLVLDAVGWTGPRDIDLGATLMPWWWLTGTNAGDALNDLVKSEGPPAIFYIAPDGTATFRDRTHRLLRNASRDVQGTYTSQEVDCAAPAVTGLHFTDPFDYATGWRDILNSVNFAVSEREIDGTPSVVWSTDAVIPVGTGQTVVLSVSATDVFVGALVPVLGTDYTATGAGTVNVVLGSTSGGSTTLLLTATGGDMVVQGMQLQACTLPVVRTVNVGQTDAGSVLQHGTQAYPDTAPWAGAEDAYAIASVILLRYAQRRPIVQMRVSAADPEHYVQILDRTVSDLIHITNEEMGLDSDFYVEHVAHTAQRMSWSGRPPVHAVILGCEEQSFQSTNPFTFDQRGAGFDQGVFDPPSSDNPDTVFVFDDPVQGVFDVGVLGT